MWAEPETEFLCANLGRFESLIACSVPMIWRIPVRASLRVIHSPNTCSSTFLRVRYGGEIAVDMTGFVEAGAETLRAFPDMPHADLRPAIDIRVTDVADDGNPLFMVSRDGLGSLPDQMK